MTGIVTGLQREIIGLSAPDPTMASEVAIVGESPCVYSELWSRVRAFAGAMACVGVEPGDRVAIWLPKGTGYVVAILATLRLGACYVPLDIAQPAERSHVVLQDADPVVLIAESDGATGPGGGGIPMVSEPTTVDLQRVSPAPQEVDPESDAALLYTSGSTGVPKGVRLTHRNVTAFIRWCLEVFPVSAEDLVVNHAPFTFDISLHGLFVPLAVGGSVLVLPDESRKNPLAMAAAMRRERPTVWYSVPSALDRIVREAADALGAGTSLRTVLFAGEEYPPARLAQLSDQLPAGVVLANLYGPTETNVCLAHTVDRGELDGTTSIPLGRPASGAQIALLDEVGNMISKPDSLGEIAVTGTCVSPGYHGHESRHPLDDRGRRRYYTGDLGSYDAAGRLRFHGRADRQVQVGGHRVELGEIEAALGRMPGVLEVAVERVVIGERPQLVAFVAGDSSLPGLLAVKQHCAAHVPRYMIPQRLKELEVMPRNANGKIDHEHLVALFNGIEVEVSRR